MKRLITVVFAGLFATSTASQTIPETPPPGLFAPADMADLSEFLWKKTVSYTHLTLPTIYSV